MHPAKWGAAYGNSWRTTNDIADTWDRSQHLSLTLPAFLRCGVAAVVPVLDCH